MNVYVVTMYLYITLYIILIIQWICPLTTVLYACTSNTMIRLAVIINYFLMSESSYENVCVHILIDALVPKIAAFRQLL